MVRPAARMKMRIFTANRPTSTYQPSQSERGFTLVELMVVLSLAALLAAYGGYVGAASVLAARAAGQWHTLARLPVVIAAFHVAYGLGTWRGLWDVLRGRQPSTQFARITR